MNRDEILAKSRKENNVSDERAQWIALKGANFSVTVLLILWAVLYCFVDLEDAARSAMGMLVYVTCCSNFAYQWVRCRTKTSGFFAVLFFLLAVSYLLLFLRYVLHVF